MIGLDGRIRSRSAEAAAVIELEVSARIGYVGHSLSLFTNSELLSLFQTADLEEIAREMSSNIFMKRLSVCSLKVSISLMNTCITVQ